MDFRLYLSTYKIMNQIDIDKILDEFEIDFEDKEVENLGNIYEIDEYRFIDRI